MSLKPKKPRQTTMYEHEGFSKQAKQLDRLRAQIEGTGLKPDLTPYAYDELFNQQNAITEHRWNHDEYHISKSIEAAGDIYRELGKRYIHWSYVNEKVGTLDRYFLRANEADKREMNEYLQRPEYRESMKSFIPQIELLHRITVEAEFGERKTRRRAMLASCDAVRDLARYGAGELSYEEAQKSVMRLMRETEQLESNLGEAL